MYLARRLEKVINITVFYSPFCVRYSLASVRLDLLLSMFLQRLPMHV